MRIKTIFRSIAIILFVNVLSFSAYAQLDTRHYIPPMYGRVDRAEGGGEDIYLLISTPKITAIDVEVTDGAGVPLSFSPVSVSRSSPVSVALSTAAGASKGPGTKFLITDAELATVLTNEGLILTGNKAFFASIRVDEGAQAASLTSKGTSGFGKEFRTGHIWNDGAATNLKSHIIAFMATEDNTNVKVSDFGTVDFENVTEVGGEINVTLNAGESYVLAAFVDNPSTANLNDVNGTRITSDKEIIVNSGSWLGGAPGGGGAGRDIGIDQIASIEETGFEYILVKGEGTSNENVLVVAAIDGTQIYLNGSVAPVNPTPLNAGEYYRLTATDYSVNENMYIQTNQPTYVYQGLNGAVSPGTERQLGLNFMPPIVCLGGTNVDMSDIDQLGNAVIQIIGETGEQVTITDEFGFVTDISGTALAVTGNSNYVTYKATGYTGNVTVASPRPIRVALTVESGNIGAAGFFSGFTTAPVIETPNGYNSTTCIPDNLPVVLEAAGFDSYQWYKDNVLLSGETSATISVTSPGVYTATGSISGCVSSEQSFPLTISLCPGDVGAAKHVVSTSNVTGSVFDVVYDLVITNYSATNPAPNLQLTDNITDGLPAGATVSVQVAPVIQSGSFTNGGISTTFNGDTDIALLQTSAASVDTELATSSSVTIRFTVRVDMTAATSPAYTNQSIVSTALIGPNDGITAIFDNQDFSHAGTNPDPNNNNDPTEPGENDATEVCLSTTTISYESSIYYTTGTDPTPDIVGLSGGTFSSSSGLIINAITGEIDVSASIVDVYTVTYSFGGLCPTTTTVEIALNPPTEPTIISQITNDNTPTITGTAVLGVGETLTVNVNSVDYLLGTDPEITISGTTWTLAIPVVLSDNTYDVVATIDEVGPGTRVDTTIDELIIETVAPTVDIQDEPIAVNSTASYNVTIEFSEDVTGVNITDITVGNGAASNFIAVDGNTYTVDITPNGLGNITIDVAAAIAQDLAGNDNTAATQAITIFDNVPPATPTVTSQTTNDTTPVITGTNGLGTALPAGETMTVTVNGATYAVVPDGSGNWSVDTGTDVPVSGTLGSFTDGTSYEVVATVTDAATNATTDVSNNEVTIDTTPPAVDIRGEPASVNSTTPYTVIIDFGEPVTGFVSSEIVVNNGAVTGFIDNNDGTFTVEITPDGLGAITIDVAASVAQDLAANDNTMAIQAVTEFDTESVYNIVSPKVVDTYANGESLATVTDADGALTLAVLASGSLPSGTSLNAITGEVTVSDATQLVAGIYSFDVTTTDSAGGTTTQTVTIEFLPVVTVDTDGDGVFDTDEDINGDNNLDNDDTDGDGIPDYLDTDDDGDGVDTANEDLDGDGNPINDDTDGDGTPNYLDTDDDGDGKITADEDGNDDGDPTNDDCDSDGIPDYLDVDRCEIVIPQGFSPNGDGINDYLVIKGIEDYSNSTITIFNRWGNRVYESKNGYKNDWDGTSQYGVNVGGSELPEGTYFIIVDFGDGNKPARANVYLKRE